MTPKADQFIEQLPEAIAGIFDQAQVSVANHKKNCVALYKLHVKAAGIAGGRARAQAKTKAKAKSNAKSKSKSKSTGKAKRSKAGDEEDDEDEDEEEGEAGMGGEEAFQDVFLDMVSRVLAMKKGLAPADRVVRYIGAFVKFMQEKVTEVKSKTASSSSISASVPRSSTGDDEDENSTTRFVSVLLNWLLQGFTAKNKNVRYRCIHIVSEMISHVGEIDEDIYTALREGLIERLADKETYVRAHAVVGLSKLAGSEDPDELKDGEQTILQTLLETISTDPAAEVRRAALMNVPLTSAALGAILSRTRDVDPVTRKLVYTGVLQAKLNHPRRLSIAQRELIVKDGLGDREPGVRVAAGKLVTSWFDAVVGEAAAGPEEDGLDSWEGDDGGVMKGLVGFLGLFDVGGPGEAVAVDAVLSVFSTRPDMPDVFVFSDAFWKDLSPESVVLARIFVNHCVSTKNETRLESSSLPVVTAFAFHIQEAYNQLLEILQEMETAKILRAGLEEQEDEELEEELAKREIIMGELLGMALKLDYGDEIGRRKIFSVVKDMLAHPQLPPGLIERCLDVLKEIMPSERDLIRVIVEIIVELREGEEEENAEEPPIDDNQSDASQATIRRDKSVRKAKVREEMSAGERMQADLTDIRCLMLCTAVLERVDGSFEDNSTLEGILADLIIPSVKRKELAMREKALVSLGLCCLIAKNMALSSFQLFLSQAQNAPNELKVQVLRIILDLLIMYDQEFFNRSEDVSKRIIDFLVQTLQTEESAEVQAVLCTGLCKLLLAGIVKDSRVLTCLALMYISPSTTENQELRQCLSYFFPVYAYSSYANQARVQEIFMPTFELAVRLHEELEDDQEMITPYQFGLLMVDWTNPQKAAEIAVDKEDIQQTHANLAVDILVALYDSDRSVDEQKALCQLLCQLQIESGLDVRSIHKVNVLLSNHEDQCPFENPPVEKIFDRFKSRITSQFSDELKGIDTREFVDDEFRDLYQKMGVDVPGEDDNGNARRPRARGKQRKKVDEEDVDEDESDEAENENGSGSEAPATEKSHSPQPAKRIGTRRSTRAAKPVAKADKGLSRHDSDLQGSDVENTPPPPTISATPKKKKGIKRHLTPSNGSLSSPANRKRTRVKAPPKMGQEATPTNTDIESPTTPTKNPRKTRASNSTSAKKSPSPVEEDGDDDGNDSADEVASTLAVSPSVSSDDFGGYSE